MGKLEVKNFDLKLGKRVLAALIAMSVMALCGCGGAAPVSSGQAAYRHISSDEAQKLMKTESSYTNIVEFGGIIDWRGEVVKD